MLQRWTAYELVNFEDRALENWPAPGCPVYKEADLLPLLLEARGFATALLEDTDYALIHDECQNFLDATNGVEG